MAIDTSINSTEVTPQLEAGDCLTQPEFERRYLATPDCGKAELLEGIVYMNAAVRVEQHGEPHSDLVTLFGVYKAATPGVRSADTASIRLDLENVPPARLPVIHRSGLWRQRENQCGRLH